MAGPETSFFRLVKPCLPVKPCSWPNLKKCPEPPHESFSHPVFSFFLTSNRYLGRYVHVVLDSSVLQTANEGKNLFNDIEGSLTSRQILRLINGAAVLNPQPVSIR